MIVINKISVKDALLKIEKGESLESYEIDFRNVKIEALNVMKLAKAGVDVPESLIYYDDADIAYDSEFDDYEWKRMDIDPITFLDNPIAVSLDIDPKVKEWILLNEVAVKPLLEKLLHDFYNTQQLVNNEV